MKTSFLLMLSFAMVLGTTKVQADSFLCQGQTRSEVLTFRTMTPKEMQKQKNAVRGLVLTMVSDKLCEGYTSIEGGRDEYPLTATKKEVSSNGTSFSVWDGNWGWNFAVPNKVFGGMQPREQFRVSYKFIYNDIVEAQVTRTLTCIKN